MNNCKIYLLLDPNTNEVKYVGQTTKTIEVRLTQHIKLAKRKNNSYLCRWINKLLNEEKKPKIISFIENAEWNIDEIKWIKQFRNDGYDLVNTTNGGEGILGYKHTNETKKILSNASKKYFTENIPYWKNKKIPEIVKEKMSLAKLGIKKSKESIDKRRLAQIGVKKIWSQKGKISYLEKRGKKVICIETGVFYKSIKTASQAVGQKQTGNISLVCEGKREKCSGFHWKYA